MDIFQEEGGGLPNTKLFEELFFLSLDIFQEGGGLPDYKNFEELFCLRLDIFEERGGLPDSKDDEEIFLVSTWTFFKLYLRELPNTLRNYSLYKIRFKKKFLKGFQK